MFHQIDGHYSVTKSFSQIAVLRGSRGSLISHKYLRRDRGEGLGRAAAAAAGWAILTLFRV